MSFVITEPYQFIAGLDGEALDGGFIYYGEPNQDPVQYPKSVYFDAALTIPAPQPLRTVNGYIVRNGSPTFIFTSGNYSITVLDKLNRQVYHVPDFMLLGNSQPVTRDEIVAPVDTIADLRALDKTRFSFAETAGYYAAADGGAGTYWLDASDISSVDNGGTIIVATDGGRWKLTQREYTNVKQFGAKGDGITNDAAKIQAAVDATPNGGTVVFPAAHYIVTSEITLPKPITIKGKGTGSVTGGISGGQSDTDFPCIQQTDNTKSIFKMVARLGNYAFGSYGILDINFADIHLMGKAINDRSVSAVTTDTTINGGEYHVRHIHFNNVLIRFFNKGVDFTGISYLNVFVQTLFYWCDTGFYSAKGASSDVGAGQTRFIGCTFDQMNTGNCLSLNMDSQGGSFSFTDCTISESLGGIAANSHVSLTVTGCMFESIHNGGGGAAIYIKMDSSSGLNHDSTKYIVGNQFLTNDYDIVIDKLSTLNPGGTFSFPWYINGNSFTGTTNKSLQINLQPGDLPLSAKNFVLGNSNSGSNAGFMADSQISTNYAGLDLRKFSFRRRFVFNNAALPANFLVVPEGVVMVKARVYFTANASSSTGFNIGDQSNGGRYLTALNAQTATLNLWYGWQDASLPQVITNSTMTNLGTSFTAGANGAAGVVEIEYYVP